ncbi:MAG: YidC/Oxa1 family insertase periplasmic-domain containing protein [Candidatus Riflebacteria bacterium]|nr:YidC/Oxa1 family insertase periplasmic-domain containing protein [Candidatus Riflebacteria bacterium]
MSNSAVRSCRGASRNETASRVFSYSGTAQRFRSITLLLVFLAFASGLMLFPAVSHAQTPQTTPNVFSTANSKAAPSFAPKVEIADKDADGIADASVETARLRLLFSGRTGDLIVYYLKGANFEENLYPPSFIDKGYHFASETMIPFHIGIPSRGAEAAPESQYTFHRDEDTADGRIVLTAAAYAPIGGLSLIKRYTFSPNGYAFDVEAIVANIGDADTLIGSDQTGGLSFTFGPGLFIDPYKPSSIIGLKPESEEVFENVEVFKKKTTAGGYTGIGLKTTYICVLLDAKTPVKITATDFDVKPIDPKFVTLKGENVSAIVPPFTLKAKETRAFRFTCYFGPKLLDELAAIQRATVTDYGFLSTVLLRILQFFNAIYPNYGLSIVFLTLVVRLLLYPLTLKSTKSMAKVQKIQPLVQDLKDRFKDNPQKFNEEVLKLYQKHDVNPLGGCLPMFLQLPVLIALYNTINIAVELRKTPFLWMTDLSKPDPLLLLPIGIAALMYYQQGKMPDQQQQQMMAFMPMFMFVITWSLPSGLLIYWFTSSIIGIFQQLQANQLTKAMKEEQPHHAKSH